MGLHTETRPNTHTPSEFVVRFLYSYAQQHDLLRPGRVPGYSRSDVKLLPSSVSKRGIWKTYYSASEANIVVHAVAYTTFCRLWRSLLPSIILMRQMTDLCWTCHQNSIAIVRAANSSTTNKSTALKEAEEHLCIVKVERSFYKSTCDACRESVKAHFTIDEVMTTTTSVSHHSKYTRYPSALHFWLRTTGTLSFWSLTARPTFLLYTKKVYHV